MAAAVDYDAPRRATEDDSDASNVVSLALPREQRFGVLDLDESDLAESAELPGADLSSMSVDDLVAVVPMQAHENVCSRCYLVYHSSRFVRSAQGHQVCRDCA